MRVWVAAIVLSSSLVAVPAMAQQCGKGQMAATDPSGTRCIQICPPGYSIGRDQLGYQSCLRDGNTRISVTHKRYGVITVAHGADVDHICFGLNNDFPTDSVIDDQFVDLDSHTSDSHVWIAEMSFTLEPDLKKLHLTNVRSFLVDKTKQPVGVSDPIAANIDVPLYDKPQDDWSCTRQQWARIMDEVPEQPAGSGVIAGTGGNSTARSIYEDVHRQYVHEQENRLQCGNPRGC